MALTKPQVRHLQEFKEDPQAVHHAYPPLLALLREELVEVHHRGTMGGHTSYRITAKGRALLDEYEEPIE